MHVHRDLAGFGTRGEAAGSHGREAELDQVGVVQSAEYGVPGVVTQPHKLVGEAGDGRSHSPERGEAVGTRWAVEQSGEAQSLQIGRVAPALAAMAGPEKSRRHQLKRGFSGPWRRARRAIAHRPPARARRCGVIRWFAVLVGVSRGIWLRMRMSPPSPRGSGPSTTRLRAWQKTLGGLSVPRRCR